MLITCPSCNSEYNVPGELPPGRMVKCAKCQSKWAPVPAPAPPEPEPPPEPELPAEAATVVPEPLVKRRFRNRAKPPSALTLAWVASACVLVALLATGIVWRGSVMHAWPPSTRLYAWFGMAPPDASKTARE